MVFKKIGLKSLMLLGVICFLSFSLLLQEFLPLLSALMLVFIVAAIASSFSRTGGNRQLAIDKSTLAATLPILGMAAISLAHLNVSEVFYAIASIAALYAGYVYSPPPSRSVLVTKGIPFVLFLVSILYAVGGKNEGDTLTSNFSGSIFLVSIPFWYAICNPKPAPFVLWSAAAVFVLLTFTRSILLGLLVGVVIVYYSFKSRIRTIWSFGFFVVCGLLYLKFQDEISAVYQILSRVI